MLGRAIMKSLSASIIVLTAAGLIFGGAYIRHGDTGLFVQIAGVAFAVAGFKGWFAALKVK